MLYLWWSTSNQQGPVGQDSGLWLAFLIYLPSPTLRLNFFIFSGNGLVGDSITEFKTTFSTHAGHYEFTIVSFGLSVAPDTFEGAMNSTLATLLRKCIVVFFDDILVYNNSYEVPIFVQF